MMDSKSLCKKGNHGVQTLFPSYSKAAGQGKSPIQPDFGAFTTSLSNLFQCFTTLIVKNFFLTSSLNLPSFSAEQPQLSQPVLIGEVLHPLDHFCGPPLDPLQQVRVFPVLRTPELDAVLQVGSHQSRVEGQNRLPRPAGHASFDAAQDMVGFLGCERTLPAYTQFASTNTHKFFSAGLLSTFHPPACIDTRGCPNPGAGPCAWPC
ncbi:hypothetical protein QYF61_022552 [Mycteria americana]|uniref:Uncharacterized protein n=1 Tax=Mycteria americana TaxID=33587 RepID=A0AAN7NM50_MYCAM|nr:hypothetical protein QYF61_022552 [Mycteria americana]